MKNSIINLESLLDLSSKLNEKYELEFILNSALLSLMGKLKIIRGAVLIPIDNKNNYKFALTKGKQIMNNINLEFSAEFKIISENDNYYRELYQSGYKFIIPIVYKNIFLAVILLGEKIDKSIINEDETYYIWLVSIITSISLQNTENYLNLKKINSTLESRNLLLTTFYEINKDFSLLLNKNQIIKLITYRLMGQLMVSRFALFIANFDNSYEDLVNRFSFSPPNNILKELFKLKNVVYTEELITKTDVYNFLLNSNIKIISPMIIQSQTKGLILIGNRMDGSNFSEENLLFITALSNTAISALENERLFQEELGKKQLEKEMELAFEIQKNLLPKKKPIVQGYDINGISIPARMVGGDYFDFIKISETKLLISIADVSGKGMPAALLMANVQAALRALAPLNLEIRDLVRRINKVVYDNTTSDKFVTFFAGILDTENNQFHYVNAGHNSPILLKSNGDIMELSEGGIILGILEHPFDYSNDIINLEENDLILLYTDGITESLNKNKEEFGEERLKKLIIENVNSTSSDLIDKIVLKIDEFSSEMPQNDDITIIVLKRNKKNS